MARRFPGMPDTATAMHSIFGGMFGGGGGSNAANNGFIPDGQLPAQQQQQSDAGKTPAGQDANGGQQQQQQGTQTNDGNNIDPLYSRLWQPPKDADDAGQKAATQQQQTQQMGDPMAALRQHLEGKGIFKDIDFNKLTTENNPDAWKQAMQQITTNTYTAAMRDMSDIMNHKIEEAVQAAVVKSRGVVTSDYAISQLHNAHEYMKDPAIAPVAQQVMLRAMREGKEIGEAVKFTHNYFLNLGRAAGSGSGQNNSQNGARGGSQQSSNTDWMQYLTND